MAKPKKNTTTTINRGDRHIQRTPIVLILGERLNHTYNRRKNQKKNEERRGQKQQQQSIKKRVKVGASK
jgi:hypothetical protein